MKYSLENMSKKDLAVLTLKINHQILYVGIYVQMFTTVAKNFFKFLAAYFCLLVAFALSFCVLFPNYQSFNVQAFSALVKVKISSLNVDPLYSLFRLWL